MDWLPPQTFSLFDLPLIFFLAVLEILLSTDNAVVLSIMAKKLAPPLRKKALFIGLIAAFIFRGLAILFASILIHQSWIQILGGLYLIYMGMAYFLPKKNRTLSPTPHFWKCVLMIELTDLLFAIDSILAAIALIEATPNTASSKIWIVYLGGLFGLVAMRFIANKMIKILERYPNLEISAHLIVAVIGLKLILSPFVPNVFDWLFWTLMLLLLLVGFIKKREMK